MNIGLAIRSLVIPKSADEDVRRREFILNILVVSAILLLALSWVCSSISFLFESAYVKQNDRMSLLIVTALLFLFVSLYVLSRTQRIESASFIFVTIFFLLSLYFSFIWGPDVLVAVLYYALTITMAGILLNSRFAFAIAAVFGVAIPSINYLQTHGLLAVNSYWRTEHMQLSDAFLVSVILIIIAMVAWLSNRDIERSLIRARKSEHELKIERDLLEVRVAERTAELQRLQMEKMTQAYRFVEFGRLASGLFHDLSSPLTALSLHIENEDTMRAQHAMEHMQKLMDSMRKHLQHQSAETTFSISESVMDVVNVLLSYARRKGVTMVVTTSADAVTYGDPIAFVQVLTNLISNAVESFTETNTKREVHIVVSTTDGHVSVHVRDTGSGIPAEALARIFEPFYSTKGSANGLGIGLSLAKRLVEKQFGGTLTVASDVGVGTTFTIYLPHREP